jgi:hypothetical protein
LSVTNKPKPKPAPPKEEVKEEKKACDAMEEDAPAPEEEGPTLEEVPHENPQSMDMD